MRHIFASKLVMSANTRTGHSAGLHSVALVGSLALLLSSVALSSTGCGGSSKKGSTTAAKKKKAAGKKAEEKAMTEADFAAERAKASKQIVAEGSTCLPNEKLDWQVSVQGDTEAFHLCAIDTDPARALGVVACWNINRESNALEPIAAEPSPGQSFVAKADLGCIRGYCPPTKLEDGATGHIAWSTDGKHAAVLTGDTLHIFDADKKPIKEIKVADSALAGKAVAGTPAGLAFVGDVAFVVGSDSKPTAGVWMFKTDGTAVGPVMSPNPKEKAPLSIHAGSLSVLDKDHVGVSESGLSTLTVVEASTGKKSRMVRKLPKLACKPAELTSFFAADGKEGDKCKASAEPAFSSYIGANMFMTKKKSIVASLRGSRRLDLSVLDSKTLAEKTVITLTGCK
jgi:hypothetical protein